jgi:hypothetical protein
MGARVVHAGVLPRDREEMLRAVWQTTSRNGSGPGSATSWGLEVVGGRQAIDLGRDLLGSAPRPAVSARRFLSSRLAGRRADWSLDLGGRRDGTHLDGPRPDVDRPSHP